MAIAHDDDLQIVGDMVRLRQIFELGTGSTTCKTRA